jgi:hypothetical protein
LTDVDVIRCSDGARADIPSLVGGGRAVVVWARTFGCPFCWELAVQLKRDVLPQLEAKGTKLFLVAIGTLARSADFVEVTGFPADRLLADPEGATYAALGLTKSVRATFFDAATPLSLLRRAGKPGGLDDLKERVLPRWQPWQPPKLDQALQQGGVLVFDGARVAFAHRDQATGAHADLGDVVAVATRLAEESEANAAACAAATAAADS